MRDFPPEARFIVVGLACGLLIAIIGGIFVYFRSPETIWLVEQEERCAALHSDAHYDKKTKILECWRTPMLRMPKLMFQEKYETRS